MQTLFDANFTGSDVAFICILTLKFGWHIDLISRIEYTLYSAFTDVAVFQREDRQENIYSPRIL